MVDASDDHLGASLQQQVAPTASWEPLGFFLKKLDLAQTRYSDFNKEFLTCMLGIQHF